MPVKNSPASPSPSDSKAQALRRQGTLYPHPEKVTDPLYMANCHSSGDWQFKQSVAMALPTVILKAGWLRCWAARYLPGCVAR